jgi:hypothetical protein
MKNRKQLTVSDIIWLVSKITHIVGESMTTQQGELYCWDFYQKDDESEIILDTEKREIQLVNCVSLDVKTYYALHGLASITGLKVEDYYRD